MVRSLKFSLELANSGKRRKLDALWGKYGDSLNRIIEVREVIGERLDVSDTGLRLTWHQAAERQAVGVTRGTKETGMIPKVKRPCIHADHRQLVVRESKNSFDKWIRISTLISRDFIYVPIRNYDYAKKYFALNRSGESFCCRRCGFAADADHVGATNILYRFIQEPVVPEDAKSYRAPRFPIVILGVENYIKELGISAPN